MRKPVRITLESTDEVGLPVVAARVWRGRSDDGVPVLAAISILALPSGDERADVRMRRALGTRIRSSAVIEIPAPRRARTSRC